MRFFLLVILLSSQVQAKTAEQCMTEAVRATIGLKLSGLLSKKTFGETGGEYTDWNGATPSALCADLDKVQNFLKEMEDQKSTKLKMIKLASRELKEKGKIDGGQFASDKDYLKENEICPELEKSELGDRFFGGSCPNADSALMKKITGIPFESSSIENHCSAFASAFITGKRDCDVEHNKASEVTREPPGEEIAPAEDEPVKVKLKKPVVEAVQPAKVDLNSKPRAGGSSQ